MRRIILLTLLTTIFSTLHAQNWKPVTSVDRYNYVKDSTYFTVWVDSTALVNGDSVFYLNKVLKKVKNGTTNGMIAYYLENQSQFFLSKMIYTSSGDVLMKENESFKFLLKPLAKVNDTWVFDSLKKDTATVISELGINVLGSTDSVKVITLSTSKDTIILSKNFGILKFPVYDSLHQNISLVGIETRGIGVSIPKFKDMFDFHVGDVFCYEYDDHGHYSDYYTKAKITIRKREETATTLKYTVNYASKTVAYVSGVINTTYSSVPDSIMVYQDSATSFFNKYTDQVLNAGGNDEIKKPVKVFTGTKFNVIAKSYPYYPFCDLGDTIVNTTIPLVCSTYRHNKIYGKGLGLIYSKSNPYSPPYSDAYSYTNLIGYIKDGKQVGVITEDSIFLAVSKYDKLTNYRIYPNPGKDDIVIESPMNEKISVRIFNIEGKELLTQQFQTDKMNIDISNLASGIYFVKLMTEKAVDVVKIVKE